MQLSAEADRLLHKNSNKDSVQEEGSTGAEKIIPKKLQLIKKQLLKKKADFSEKSSKTGIFPKPGTSKVNGKYKDIFN